MIELANNNFNEFLSNTLDSIDNNVDTITNNIGNWNNTAMQSYIDSVHFCNQNISECVENCTDKIINQMNSFDWRSVLVPALTSLIVFLIGEFIRFHITQKKRLNEIRSESDIITQQILSLSMNVKLFVGYISECAENMKSNSDINPVQLQLNIISLDMLKQYGQKTLNTDFIINRKTSDDNIEHIQNVISQIDYLEKSQIEVRNLYNGYHDYGIMYLKKWNELARNINIMIGSLSEATPRSQSFIDFCNNLSIPQMNNPTIIDRNAFVNNVYEPLLIHCKANAELDFNQKMKWQLIDNLNCIIMLKRQIDFHNKGNAEVLEKYAKRISVSYNSLKDSITILNRQDFKCIFKIK